MAEEAKVNNAKVTDENSNGCAIVVGYGEGMGRSLAMRFALGGYNIALVGRTKEKLDAGADEIGKRYPKITVKPFAADTSNAEQCKKAFAAMTAAKKELGRVEVLLFNTSMFVMKPFLESSLADLENPFNSGTKGLFIWAQLVIPDMLTNESKTSILVTGATAALRGGGKFGCFAANKFAMRALTQSLAREFGPKGIHCANFIIDGMVLRKKEDADANNNGTFMNPNDIADAYYFVHQQPPSAWVQEMDLRTNMANW